MADMGTTSKDADGRPQRAKTATACIDSRKVTSDQEVETDCDDDEAPVGRHASNIAVSDGEQRRDVRPTINRSSSVAVIDSDTAPLLRLLVVSSKIRNSAVMQSAVLPNVLFVQYKYETATIDTCLGKFCDNDSSIYNTLCILCNWFA